jgi:lipopolysaccharide transport system ATP-binding protein
MTHEVSLTLDNVGVKYRRSYIGDTGGWAIKDISFEVYRGETLGVIGRHGAGKSTLLRVLAGIYAPDQGAVDHHDNTASLLALQVGFLPYLTGRQNAILSGMLLGRTKAEMEQRLPKILDFTGLHEVIEHPLATYSSGMKARLGFGVSYFAEADILLIDEVLGVGDVEFRAKSTKAMREKIKSNNTVVLVSHNPGLIRRMCDRAVWIEHGRVHKIGEARQLLREYQREYPDAPPRARNQ